MTKSQFIEAGAIACPQCGYPISVHWQLLQQGVNPHCMHCGLTLVLDRTSSDAALKAASRLNDSLGAAEQRRLAAMPPRGR